MSNFSANTVSNPSAVNTAAKDILARILAGENLIVEHDPKAHTAMFDTKNRVLTLPVWDNMSESMYDMLIGHEVGHALFTPAWSERDEAAGGIASAIDIGGAGNAHIAMEYLNVVEDVRIERLVQDKFPGIRRDFFTAYGEMVTADFFGIKGKNLNDLPLIDRLNIHFKLGTQSPQQITFTPDEQKFVDRIAAAESFDDVTVIAKDLYEFCGNKRNDEKRKEFVANMQTSSGSGQGDESDQEGNPADSADSNNEANDSSSKNNGRGNGDQDGEADSDNKKGDIGGNEASTMSQTPARSFTQKSIDNNLSKHRNASTRSVSYGILDTPKLENIIWDYKQFLADMQQYATDQAKNNPQYFAAEEHQCRQEFNDFITEATPLVANMVKQFEMRKAADKAKRTSVSRSGVIDTVRMMNYKLTDDIFRRNTFVADGKNHGLVMFIDWSSSMSNVIKNTVKQLMILVMFCRKVNIPFEVYSFTSVPVNPNLSTPTPWGGKESLRTNYWTQNAHGKANAADFATFNLVNFMSSRMSSSEYKIGLEMLYRVAYGAFSYTNTLVDTNKYGLGSTPLDECIVAAMDIVPKFREANRLQIVNTVFLTDGESSGNSLPVGHKQYGHKAYIIDPVTKKTYESDGDNYTCTDTLLRIFRDRTKTNAIGFFLQSNKTLWQSSAWYANGHRDEKAFSAACNSYSDFGFAESLPNYRGYTVQYIIRSIDMTVSNSNDHLDSLKDGRCTVAQVTKALAKDAAQKLKSKMLLNRFIDLIAKA